MAKKIAKPLTNAEFAFAISHVLRTAAIATTGMAEGMWNPDFCSDTAGVYAISVVDDIEHQIKHLKRRLPKKI